MKFHVDFQRKQRELYTIYEDGWQRIVGYGGARGGAKSRALRDIMLLRRLKYANTDGVVIRRTYQDLRDNHIQRMLLEHPALRGLYIKSEKVIQLPNGSNVKFLSADNYDDVFAIIGKEYADIMIDQAEQFTQEQIEHIRTNNRCTTNPNITPKMLLTFNPGDVGHNYLKRIFIKRQFEKHEQADEYYFQTAFGWDNVEWVKKELVALGKTVDDYYDLTDEGRIEIFIKSEYGRILNSLPEIQRRAQLLGDFDVFAGQFFPEFRQSIHVQESERADWTDIVGVIDYGGRTVLELGYRDYAGVIHIVDECYTEEMSPASRFHRMADKLISLELKGIHILCDTNMSQKLGNYIQGGDKMLISIADEVFEERMGRDKPILLTVNKSLPNYRQQCNEAVREYLNWEKEGDEWKITPRVYISKKCTGLLRELPSLVHSRNSADGLDFEQKGFEDDAYDAFKYLLMELRTPNKPKEKMLIETDEQRRSSLLSKHLEKVYKIKRTTIV